MANWTKLADGSFGVKLNGKIYKKPQLGVVKRKVPAAAGRTILINEELDVFIRFRSGKTYYVSTLDPNHPIDDNNLRLWLDRPVHSNW